MLLKFKNKDTVAFEVEGLETELQNAAAQNAFLLASFKALLEFIKDFSLDIEEIQSDAFKENVDSISNHFSKERKLRRLQSSFTKNKKMIAAFIERQKQYLEDREYELKDIIDLLTKAMVELDSDAQEYNQKILKQSEKIERITHLDDIKKIKQALAQEIEQIRETVKEKQTQDLAKLEKLSKQVTTLNVQLKTAREESLTDGLTGINNRKAFDQYLQQLVAQNTKSKRHFSVLLLDIDDFKKVNDSHGHQIGDRVILAVVNKCRQSIRNEDFMARYGGEEFVIILPGASHRDAVKKAEHICNTIGSTRYSLEDVKPGQTLSVTVSIGVSRFRKSDTITDVLKRADKALYRAKHSGKNCVVSEKDLENNYANIAGYS
jgi:diguanylate cyclase